MKDTAKTHSTKQRAIARWSRKAAGVDATSTSRWGNQRDRWTTGGAVVARGDALTPEEYLSAVQPEKQP